MTKEAAIKLFEQSQIRFLKRSQIVTSLKNELATICNQLTLSNLINNHEK